MKKKYVETKTMPPCALEREQIKKRITSQRKEKNRKKEAVK